MTQEPLLFSKETASDSMDDVTSKTNCGSRRPDIITSNKLWGQKICRMHHSYAVIKATFTDTQPPTPPKDTKDKAKILSLSHSRRLPFTELYRDHILLKKKKPLASITSHITMQSLFTIHK